MIKTGKITFKTMFSNDSLTPYKQLDAEVLFYYCPNENQYFAAFQSIDLILLPWNNNKYAHQGLKARPRQGENLQCFCALIVQKISQKWFF